MKTEKAANPELKKAETPEAKKPKGLKKTTAGDLKAKNELKEAQEKIIAAQQAEDKEIGEEFSSFMKRLNDRGYGLVPRLILQPGMAPTAEFVLSRTKA